MESKLHDVKGRVNYISSPERQENLYAVFANVEDSYGALLAEQNQRDFAKSGTEGTCIEARELIIMLPPSLIEYDHELLLKYMTSVFLEKYDVGCCAALHHNKSKTNLHIHLIFSEREIRQEVERKIASRNMFYNESGRHVRTKKEILDGDGKVRRGCRVIKKGEVYERILFDKKDVSFQGTIPGDQFIIWMPKLYPNQSEWETSLQNDDSEIHEDAAQARHEDWIGIRKHELSVLRLTFVKDTPKSPYRFMGVYRLTKMDHLHHTYERIATRVRLIGDPVDKVELLDDFR